MGHSINHPGSFTATSTVTVHLKSCHTVTAVCASMIVWMGPENLAPTWVRSPTCIVSQYRLRYPGCHILGVKVNFALEQIMEAQRRGRGGAVLGKLHPTLNADSLSEFRLQLDTLHKLMLEITRFMELAIVWHYKIRKRMLLSTDERTGRHPLSMARGRHCDCSHSLHPVTEQLILSHTCEWMPPPFAYRLVQTLLPKRVR